MNWKPPRHLPQMSINQPFEIFRGNESIQHPGKRLREISNQIARRYIQLRSECAERAGAKERMQLLTENGFMDVAIQPRADHRTQAHLVHARHETTNRPVPLNKIDQGQEQFLAG